LISQAEQTRKVLVLPSCYPTGCYLLWWTSPLISCWVTRRSKCIQRRSDAQACTLHACLDALPSRLPPAAEPGQRSTRYYPRKPFLVGVGVPDLLVRLSGQAWLLHCSQRMQTAWRGILVCLCKSRGETDQELSGPWQRPDPCPIGAGRAGTRTRSASRSVAAGRNSKVSIPAFSSPSAGEGIPSQAALPSVGRLT